MIINNAEVTFENGDKLKLTTTTNITTVGEVIRKISIVYYQYKDLKYTSSYEALNAQEFGITECEKAYQIFIFRSLLRDPSEVTDLTIDTFFNQ